MSKDHSIKEAENHWTRERQDVKDRSPCPSRTSSPAAKTEMEVNVEQDNM